MTVLVVCGLALCQKIVLKKRMVVCVNLYNLHEVNICIACNRELADHFKRYQGSLAR